MNIEKLVSDLETRAAAHATAGLVRPVDKSLFGYGFLSGYVTAMEEAKELILNAYKDADENPRRRF